MLRRRDTVAAQFQRFRHGGEERRITVGEQLSRVILTSLRERCSLALAYRGPRRLVTVSKTQVFHGLSITI